MQPLALHLVNSIFLGDYLTSEGQAGQADLDLIADAGFEVEGADATTLPAHRVADAGAVCGTDSADGEAGCGSHAGGCGSHGGVCAPHGGVCAPREHVDAAGREVAAERGPDPEPVRPARAGLVSVRRRGAGTDLPPNA
jgi:biotin synthase